MYTLRVSRRFLWANTLEHRDRYFVRSSVMDYRRLKTISESTFAPKNVGENNSDKMYPISPISLTLSSSYM